MNDLSYDQPYPSHRVPVLARNIVATSQPLAAQAGMTMLLNGGNAVDAALAAAMTLTVVEPTANGLGGDAFAIVWDGTALHELNGSGRAPGGWVAERFADLVTMPATGWESVTVPGAVSVWTALSERFGRLALQDLFQPAIRYAVDGFPVSPTIARLVGRRRPTSRPARFQGNLHAARQNAETGRDIYEPSPGPHVGGGRRNAGRNVLPR